MYVCMYVKSLKMSCVLLYKAGDTSYQSTCVSCSPGLDPKTRFCKGVSAESNAPVRAPPRIPLSQRRRQFPMKVSTDQYFFPLVLPSSLSLTFELKFGNNTLSPKSNDLWFQWASDYVRLVPKSGLYISPTLSSTHIKLKTWSQE
jgi:hypothetical protein